MHFIEKNTFFIEINTQQNNFIKWKFILKLVENELKT